MPGKCRAQQMVSFGALFVGARSGKNSPETKVVISTLVPTFDSIGSSQKFAGQNRRSIDSVELR